MAAMLETPSRVWRRIEAVEGRDMPSLPSLPSFDDSADQLSESTEDVSEDVQITSPIHSTPAPISSHTRSTIRPPSSTSSTARFAHSIASRSSKSALSISRATVIKQDLQESFDISSIPSLPNIRGHGTGDMDIHSSDQDTEDNSIPEDYLPPTIGDDMDGDLDISDALQSISRPNSPSIHDTATPKKTYDYSVSLKSEKQPSPFDRMRNVAFRRPLSRTRTPSLTRTTPSPSSSSSHSTPRSNSSIPYTGSEPPSPLPGISVPLPPSAGASPNAEEGEYTDALQLTLEEGTAPGLLRNNSQEGGSQGRNVSEQSQSESREPTFSSEEAPTQTDRTVDESNNSNTIRGLRSPTPFSAVFSSPGPSAVFTPTPAFQPRARARFNAPPPPLESTTPQFPSVRFAADGHRDEESTDEHDDFHTTQDTQDHDADLEDPTTPHAHKRSFLLSVINSTARPRLKFPTPHPHRTGGAQQISAPMTPGVNLQTALAGVAPRPQLRPRLSHPLAQTWTPAPAPASDTQSNSGSESPYDTGAERASFISTASSHDLTTHVRANASFDPVIGLGERGHGVGRFNAGKLNAYLHGLNRRLQEENEMLVGRLKVFEEKFGKNGDEQPTPARPQPQVQGRRASGGGRRVSTGPGLGDVAEDVAEAWVEEKAALDEMVEELKEELEKVTTEKDKAEQTLQQEKGDRSKDKEKWRARMAEVEKGVEGIVSDLEVRLQEAEQIAKATESDKAQAIKDAESRLAVMQVEKDGLAERLKKAESALASGRDLGAELNTANERLAKAVGDLKNANTQMKELEEEVMRADERTDALEKEIREKKALGSKRDEELQAKDNELAIASQRISTLDEDVRRAQEKLQKSQAYVAQLEADAKAAAERVENLEQELAAAHQKIEDLSADVEQERDEADKLMDEADKASEAARRMEEAVEAAEKNVLAAEEEVAALRAKVESLERAIEREQERSRAQLGPSQSQIAADVQADIEALETELDDAHKEIARLNTVVSQSPARKAIEKAKDAKIELLEKEKEDLLERVKAFRRFSNTPGTPGRRVSTSAISPMHRQILALSMRSPKTPGGPLRDLSWLHTTMHDPSTAPLFKEIARLQEQLDRANDSIDDKLDKLEDAGCGVVGLTKQLEDAREKAVALEDELSRLTRREERRYQRLQRARCAKCQSKVDLRGLHRAADGDESSLMEISTMSLPSEPPTSPSRPTEADVRTFNAQLDSMKKAWEDEKSKLVGENAALQDAATRLNMEVRNAKDEIKKFVKAERTGEKARAGIEGELEKAKRTIDELEAELKAERGHLRTLTTEQSRAQRDKEGVVLQLHRTEADMADVREQLQRIKQENNDLEKELRSNTNAEQKVRLLEMKVAENTDTIERLRQERSLLAADHKELQQRYSKASETVNRLRSEHAASQTSHDSRQHQLNLRLLEIEDLRRALADQADDLARAESEKNRIAAEKGDVARTVAALEADLRRVKKDAEAFGRDLKLLRTQKDRLEEERKEEQTKTARAQKQSLAQIRLLKEELDGQREKVQAAKDHVCVADGQQLAAIKTQHNKECKGLIVQIRYLKAKFTRESALRSDLGYQKCYLIAIIARLQRNEDAVFASIARIGFPDADPPATNPRQRRTFKSVICSVVFITRVKHASALWREQSSSKQAIAVALQEVRRIRAVSTKDSN